ncbi:MAG: MFS transporter, partial [Chitinophagaceae bacterium]
MQPARSNSIFNIIVIVAALGYFVDIYDLLLFGIIRVNSLTSLGLSPDEVSSSGELIIQWQMWGLLIGGIIAGIV